MECLAIAFMWLMPPRKRSETLTHRLHPVLRRRSGDRFCCLVADTARRLWPQNHADEVSALPSGHVRIPRVRDAANLHFNCPRHACSTTVSSGPRRIRQPRAQPGQRAHQAGRCSGFDGLCEERDPRPRRNTGYRQQSGNNIQYKRHFKPGWQDRNARVQHAGRATQ